MLTLLKIFIIVNLLMLTIGIAGITIDYWFDPLIDFLGLNKWADKKEKILAKRFVKRM